MEINQTYLEIIEHYFFINFDEWPIVQYQNAVQKLPIYIFEAKLCPQLIFNAKAKIC